MGGEISKQVKHLKQILVFDQKPKEVVILGLFHGLYRHVLVLGAHHKDHRTFPKLHLNSNDYQVDLKQFLTLSQV